ncbi:transcription cofactor vestigial-like protein 2 [Tupaia chinensis]|uniref:transcription cofactor vestigial-like protein 2 n=1 Tax=Tupaia chinensis TaxID=246437 RepID=UPI0007046685|nr:transcription cofactor vestigial-like protein 2 [Tupaia chinensis]
MSCLDVMYQVYGPPQPYFAAAYTPYHQKLAYYSKMQEAQECNASPGSSGSGSSSVSSQTPASIKEEEGSPEKERPPEAEYINSRCVLFTYFQGDISSVVDEHFSRALSQPSSYSPSCASSKAPRSSGPWRDGSFPMSQRSFPASFWNSAYQAPVPATLGSPLAAAHSELPFAAADPYSPPALHRPHFDPRYGPLLMPAASGRPARLAPAPAPASGSPACELSSKGEPTSAAWAAPGGPFANPAGDVAQGLGLSVDSARRYSLCGASLLS